MTSARDEILGRLGRATAAPRPTTGDAHADRRARARLQPDEARRRFASAAASAAATVAEVSDEAAVADAIADFLASAELPLEVSLGGDPPGLAPGRQGRLSCERRALRADGDTLVCGCLAALAEEGAVVLTSGPAHATESAFVAATLVVVVRAAQLLDALEDLWPQLRVLGTPPRMVNVIRGPSRTADLGLPSRLGAHGPLRVHVVVVARDTARAPAVPSQ